MKCPSCSDSTGSSFSIRALKMAVSDDAVDALSANHRWTTWELSESTLDALAALDALKTLLVAS